MAYRKIYNQLGVYSSIVPATGYHFLDYDNNPINSIYSVDSNGVTGFSNNGIFSLLRITDAAYSFNESRTDFKQIGTYGASRRPVISIPPVSLSLAYTQMGLLNEAILGFKLSEGNLVNPLSGFLDRTAWPIYRDCKNLFIATYKENSDFNSIVPNLSFLNGSTGSFLTNDIYVYAFGDCYLDSYKVSAQVGDFPKVNVDFTAYNVSYVSGGTGNIIPSLNPKDSSPRTGIIYCLPPVYTGYQSTVILPSDITLDITEVSGNSQLYNLPISWNDIKLQKFDINLSLNREPLNNVGYRLPMDRRINPPIYASLDLSAIVGDTDTGSFIDFINNDTNYNVSINMRYSRHQYFTGTAINYKFLGCKFDKLNIADSINGRRMVNIGLTTEIKSNNISEGFFISGQLGTLINPYSIISGLNLLSDFGYVNQAINFYLNWGNVTSSPTSTGDYGSI